MLEGVVERGTAKNINARGFKIAGKTGTSKIAQGSKGYGNQYQASFCGYFPSQNPMYSCIVVVQGPTKNIFGSVVSGTVFKEIADKVYAQEFHKETILYNDSLNRFPYSRNGNKNAFLVASKTMNIPVDDLSDETSQLIATRTGNNAIKIISKNTKRVSSRCGWDGFNRCNLPIRAIWIVCSASWIWNCQRTIYKSRL